MINLWGSSQYGVYAYYITVATLVLAFSEFGTPNLFRNKINKSSNRQLFFSNIFFVRLITIPLSSIFFVVLFYKYDSWFFLCYSAICLLTVFRLNEYSLEVEAKNELISKVKVYVYFSGLILKVALINFGFTLEFIALISLFEHVAFTVLFYIFTNNSYINLNFDKSLFISFFKMSAGLALSYLMMILGGKVYNLLIFNILGAQDTGVFSFSNRIVEILLIPTQVFFAVMLPLLSSYSSKIRLRLTYGYFVSFTMFAYLVICLLSILLIPFVLPFIVSDSENINGFLIIYILTLPLFVSFSLSNLFLNVLSEVRLMFFRSLILLLLSITSGCFFLFLNPNLNSVILSIIFSYIGLEVITLLISNNESAKTEFKSRFFGVLNVHKINKAFSYLKNINILR